VAFDLRNLLLNVFDPQPGEVVLVACDFPHDTIADTPLWKDRRDMAVEWRNTFDELGHNHGFETGPLLTYAATGANGADLPVGDAPLSPRSNQLRGTISISGGKGERPQYANFSCRTG